MMFAQEGRERLGLPKADFEGEFSAQMPRGLRDEPLDDLGPFFSTHQRGVGIREHFAGEFAHFRGGDVGEICDDELKIALEPREQIALVKLHAFGQSEPLRILPREREGGGEEVHRFYPRLRPGAGQGERDHATPGADIERSPGERLHPVSGEKHFAKVLCLGPGDERTGIALEGAPQEFHRAEEVLKRLATRAPAHQLAKRLQVLIGKRAVKLEIELHPLEPEHMSEQMLDIQARTLHPALLEEGGRRLDDFEHGFHPRFLQEAAAQCNPHLVWKGPWPAFCSKSRSPPAMTFTISLIILAIFGVIIGLRIARHGVAKGMAITGLSIALGLVRFALHQSGDTAKAAAAEPATPAQKSYLYRLESGAELQVKLAALRKREADLQERKAELTPGDQAGAQALTKEIAKYNEDLKPVLEALKDRPELAQ